MKSEVNYKKWERMYREKTGQPIPSPEYDIIIGEKTMEQYIEQCKKQDPWRDPWEDDK